MSVLWGCWPLGWRPGSWGHWGRPLMGTAQRWCSCEETPEQLDTWPPADPQPEKRRRVWFYLFTSHWYQLNFSDCYECKISTTSKYEIFSNHTYCFFSLMFWLLLRAKETLSEQKGKNKDCCLLCCCHLCSGGHFLCSSGHYTQGVKGEHAQLPGAHSRLWGHTHKKWGDNSLLWANIWYLTTSTP